MPTVSVNGADLYYEEHGEGLPVLGIHGTPSSAVVWADAALELAQHGRCIIYDRRGFNRSAPPEPFRAIDLLHHVDDAAALLAALHAGPAVIIGRSTGGQIALELARHFPDKVKALVLLEPALFTIDPKASAWAEDARRRLLEQAAADPSRLAEAVFRDALGDDVWESFPAALKDMLAATSPAVLAELRGHGLDLSQDPADLGEDDLAGIRRPALVITAEDSLEACRLVNDRLAGALPYVESVLVPGGHLINPPTRPCCPSSTGSRPGRLPGPRHTDTYGSSEPMETADHESRERRIDRALQELHSRLAGELIQPGDPPYDEARAVWNGMIDLRPLAIIRAGSSADIDVVLHLARVTGLSLAVRGGGHNIAGYGTVEGGLVLDLGPLRGVEVDAASQLVTVEPGATLADVDSATAGYGLAVPLGVISQTGVAGLTLGGGVGWLTRSNGLSLDNLESADVVTAAGEHVHASEEQNPELFWGLRGGGGNFGVVSSFTFRARRLPGPVLGGNFLYRPGRWKDALSAFEQWTQDLPEEMNPIVSFLVLPPEFDLGPDPWMIIGFAWTGEDHQAGFELAGQLRSAAPPDEEELKPTAWAEWQSAMDSLFPKGSRGYWKNVSFSRLDEEVIDVLAGFASEVTWFGTGIDIHHMGGAFGRVPGEATAFPNRSARFWLNIYGYWKDPAEDEKLTGFARRAYAQMQPFAEHGQYVNFLGAETGHDLTEAVRQAYGPDAYERLVALKNRYDPHNLFRLNHNIVPFPV